jgi:hypothetical protein
MNPLHVLLITYSFPPAGGVGVLRAASIARYLPAENIRLDVLTARNASAVGSDPSLFNQIPAEVTIHRSVTLDLPFSIKKGIKRLINRPKSVTVKAAAPAAGKPNFLKGALEGILLPDPQVAWLPVVTRAARSIIRKRDIDLILITVPPFSTVLLVERLRKEFPELAIVVDFRDEWLSTTFDLIGFSRSERALKVAQTAEGSAVIDATAVVAVTEAARREIRARYPQEPDWKFQLIPNGFDSTRLRCAAPSQEPRTGNRIVVAHLGTVYASTDPTTLVEALQSLPLEVKSRFRLRFIGHIEEPRFREALLQLGDMAELSGFLPQHEALTAMDDADYALLVTHDPLNVGAKFYDYVGTGKPIIATVHPDGEARRMLEELRAGWWAGNRDVEGIRRLFLDVAAHGDSLLNEFQPDKEKIAQYERKPLAQRYARMLHSIARSRNDSGTRTQVAKQIEKV